MKRAVAPKLGSQRFSFWLLLLLLIDWHHHEHYGQSVQAFVPNHVQQVCRPRQVMTKHQRFQDWTTRESSNLHDNYLMILSYTNNNNDDNHESTNRKFTVEKKCNDKKLLVQPTLAKEELVLIIRNFLIQRNNLSTKKKPFVLLKNLENQSKKDGNKKNKIQQAQKRANVSDLKQFLQSDSRFVLKQGRLYLSSSFKSSPSSSSSSPSFTTTSNNATPPSTATSTTRTTTTNAKEDLAQIILKRILQKQIKNENVYWVRLARHRQITEAMEQAGIKSLQEFLQQDSRFIVKDNGTVALTASTKGLQTRTNSNNNDTMTSLPMSESNHVAAWVNNTIDINDEMTIDCNDDNIYQTTNQKEVKHELVNMIQNLVLQQSEITKQPVLLGWIGRQPKVRQAKQQAGIKRLKDVIQDDSRFIISNNNQVSLTEITSDETNSSSSSSYFHSSEIQQQKILRRQQRQQRLENIGVQILSSKIIPNVVIWNVYLCSLAINHVIANLIPKMQTILFQWKRIFIKNVLFQQVISKLVMLRLDIINNNNIANNIIGKKIPYETKRNISKFFPLYWSASKEKFAQFIQQEIKLLGGEVYPIPLSKLTSLPLVSQMQRKAKIQARLCNFVRQDSRFAVYQQGDELMISLTNSIEPLVNPKHVQLSMVIQNVLQQKRAGFCFVRDLKLNPVVIDAMNMAGIHGTVLKKFLQSDPRHFYVSNNGKVQIKKQPREIVAQVKKRRKTAAAVNWKSLFDNNLQMK